MLPLLYLSSGTTDSKKKKCKELTSPRLWDTHAHLTDPRLDTVWSTVVDDAREAGVHGVINIGVNVETGRRALQQSAEVPNLMRVTIGLHPHEADSLTSDVISELREMAQSGHVVAIGEIGLDYHYMRSSRTNQKRAFQAQLEMAAELSLPVVIHSRGAEADVVDYLNEMRDHLNGGVLHCYTGGTAEAERALDSAFNISFTGIVTFGDSSVEDLVRYIPVERLLLETDSPYLTPAPHRGKTNSPAYLPIIARRIAELKGVSEEELISVSSENAVELFSLPEPPLD